jgi:hypothetical protein
MTNLARSTMLVVPVATIAMSLSTLAVAQQPPNTPLASVANEAKQYPDGSRLQQEYEFPNQPLSVPVARNGARSAIIGFAGAAQAQANLPDGFALLPGKTSRIETPSSTPVEPGGTRAAPAAPGAPANPPAINEKFITVHPIAYQGIPLSKGSSSTTIVSGDNRLLVVRKRGLPASVDATKPDVAGEDAVAAARRAAGQAFAGIDPQRIITALEIWVDDQQLGHLSWTFTLNSGSLTDPDVRRFWVSAKDGPRVLHWESEVYHTHHGQVTGNIWATSPQPPPPTSATANRPLADLQVTRNTDNTTQVTAPDGLYGYTTGSGNAQITATLRGLYANVQNQAGSGLQVSGTGAVANPIDLNFGASSEAELAQTSAFYWTSFVHEFAKSVLGPTALSALPVRVNINANCNAFWDGAAINFFRSGGGCPNTAYSDVILHEFGHGIDASIGGILDGGYSEGFGDSVAVLGTRQFCVGRDFFGTGTCLRPANAPGIFWPPPNPEVHDVGRRYAGFTWDLIQQLRQGYSDDEAFSLATRFVLGAAAGNPANIPDAVRLSFVVDAPDGNPAHGSPHFRALAAAADAHHIPRPPDPLVAGGATASSASFPWTPAKTVNTNSNILQTTFHLDRTAAVHISANTSANSPSPVAFRTGFYTDSNANIMWTNSLRSVSLTANQWSNFGSNFGIVLPAGDYTIYWKMWVSGATLTLSGGALSVEGFDASGASLAIAAAGVSEPVTQSASLP